MPSRRGHGSRGGQLDSADTEALLAAVQAAKAEHAAAVADYEALRLEYGIALSQEISEVRLSDEQRAQLASLASVYERTHKAWIEAVRRLSEAVIESAGRRRVGARPTQLSRIPL